MALFLIFASAFAIVALLGFQSQMVRDKHRFAAFNTSLMIGTVQLFIYKTAPDSTVAEGIAYVLGGAVGIVASIYAHDYWLHAHRPKPYFTKRKTK